MGDASPSIGPGSEYYDGVPPPPPFISLEGTPSSALGAETDFRLLVEGALDPRSQEFKEMIKLTPATLAHYRTGGQWAPAEHLLLVSSVIAHEVSQGDARIIVELPPRHGKSELCSVHTPIWFLDKWPWANVMLTTYAADFAQGFGRRVRDAFLEDAGQGGEHFLNAQVRDDVQRTDIFQTTEGGGQVSIGIGGPITGRGAHLLLVDDFLKNWAEASSDVVLQGIFNWFITTAYTRIEPGGSCIILATRWVIRDLIGMLKEQDKDHMWTVITMPALSLGQGDLMNRARGEALWPERYTAKALQKIRSVIGEFMFSGMYQQNPLSVSASKADPEMIRIVDEIPNIKFYRWVRSWDTAATKEGGDWSVGTLIGTNGRPGSPLAQTVIAGMIREQLGPAALELRMRETAEADGYEVEIVIEQEPGSSGKAYAEHLATNVLRGYRVEIKPSGGHNKWVRAQPYIAAVGHGRISMLRADWNEPHKKELKAFPTPGVHDDTVDSASQGYNKLHQSKILNPTWGRRPEDSTQIIVPGTGVIRGTSHKMVRGIVWGSRAPR